MRDTGIITHVGFCRRSHAATCSRSGNRCAPGSAGVAGPAQNSNGTRVRSASSWNFCAAQFLRGLPENGWHAIKSRGCQSWWRDKRDSALRSPDLIQVPVNGVCAFALTRQRWQKLDREVTNCFSKFRASRTIPADDLIEVSEQLPCWRRQPEFEQIKSGRARFEPCQPTE